jgi:hypothetical protein
VDWSEKEEPRARRGSLRSPRRQDPGISAPTQADGPSIGSIDGAGRADVARGSLRSPRRQDPGHIRADPGGWALDRQHRWSAPGPVGACISENARASGNSYLHGRQRPPETPPCARLSAGGNGLRTLGPPRERVRLSHKNVSPERRIGQSRGALSIAGDRGQESSACRSDEFKIGGSEKFGPRSGYRAFCLASCPARIRRPPPKPAGGR